MESLHEHQEGDFKLCTLAQFENLDPTLKETQEAIAGRLQHGVSVFEAAVASAYDHFNGDFKAFEDSFCFATFKESTFLKLITEYQAKCSTLPITAEELNTSTVSTLKTKFHVDPAMCDTLLRRKDSLKKFLSRKLHLNYVNLQQTWVCHP